MDLTVAPPTISLSYYRTSFIGLYPGIYHYDGSLRWSWLKNAKPNEPMAKTCGGKTNARDREVVGSLPLNITNMKSIISLRISQCPKAMLWTSLMHILDSAEGHDAGAERSTVHTKEADGPSGRHRTWMKMGL